MALNFPSSPTNGQVYTDSVSGNRYVYNSANTAWLYSSNTAGGGADISGTSNTQILYNFSGTISGSDLLTFSSNTLYADSIEVAHDITAINSIFLRTTALAAANGSVVAGQLTWNPDDKTLDVGTGESILQVGQEQYIRILNQSGQTIFNANAVAYVGTVGASGKILGARAIANNSYDSKNILGIATEDIINGAEGFVTTFGKIRKIDTSMFSAGDVLYVSSSSPGALQNTKPTAPNNRVEVGIVVTSSATVGTIFVDVQRGSSLADDELANFTSLTNGDVIIYSSANGRFENNPQSVVNAGQLNGITANTIFAHANNTANAANAYSQSLEQTGNNWANTVAGYANTWANTQYGNSLAYANSVGTGANNQAGLMANAANSSASSTYLPLSGGTITGSLVINQNLTISGTTTYVNTQSLLIGDSIIVLNADLPSTVVPTENAGIEVNRGNTNSNSAIVWVESAQKWYITSNTWAGNNNWIASNADLAVLGVGANNQAGLMANAANAYSQSLEGVGNNWANTVSGYSNVWANTVAGYSNTWANTVAGYANTWANTKLSNTSGVSFAGDLYFPTGNVTIGGSTTNYKLQVYGSFAANTKSFVIDHPTKEGMKLRHGSLEGPENGVYVRGDCAGTSVINLPDYWIGLVHEDSITVSLTPYGRPQSLYVREVSNNQVIIYSEDHTLPYCYYLIQAERKDVEKMIVEY